MWEPIKKPWAFYSGSLYESYYFGVPTLLVVQVFGAAFGLTFVGSQGHV